MKGFSKIGKALASVFAAAICFVAAISIGAPVQTKSASAYEVLYGYAFIVESYQAEVTVRTDRMVEFEEKITVRFTEYLPDGATTYYRSLPVDGGDRYFDIKAKCSGNSSFSYNVKDNPDMDGFIDINCKGGVETGKTWTYEFSYTMLPARAYKKEGMSLDVIGFGSSAPIFNADVAVRLPAKYTEMEVYSGAYGYEDNGDVTWRTSDDGKEIYLHADQLMPIYNKTYNEKMTAGITISFVLPKGTLESFSSTRVTGSIWAVLISGAIVVGLAIAITIYCRKKKEIIKVVNLKAPNEMDPLRMGKLIDGAVDNEDVTSMIYWFAAKGYLVIDLTEEDDPILRKNNELPENATSYQKVLFDGLFKRGNEVHTCELSNRYYTSIDAAKNLVSAKDASRYEKKSYVGMFACLVLAFLYWIFCPLLIGLNGVGGGYKHFGMGFITLAPVIIIPMLLKTWKDRVFKTKKSKNFVWILAALAVGIVATLAYLFAFNVHVISRLEQILVCLVSMSLCAIAVRILSFTQRHAEVMGDILGFKDFIVYTEEDKIKTMLQENPELYYDILPYAQVLGVTNEWEDKFQSITLEQPSWAVGEFTVFDYLILRSVMRSATISMLSRPQNQAGGTFIGKSGGGGGFGGFSGGGSGGGGMGVR